DVVIELNGAPVDDSNTLRNKVAQLQPGTSVTLKVWRSGSERELKARLGELPTNNRAAKDSPSETPAGGLGLSVQPLTPQLAERLETKASRGLVVSKVDPDSPAAHAGFQQG